MATNARWASFDKWEGPIVPGRCPFVLPPFPTWSEKLLYVVSATEGHYDSVNCYDRAILSAGILLPR